MKKYATMNEREEKQERPTWIERDVTKIQGEQEKMGNPREKRKIRREGVDT